MSRSDTPAGLNAPSPWVLEAPGFDDDSGWTIQDANGNDVADGLSFREAVKIIKIIKAVTAATPEAKGGS